MLVCVWHLLITAMCVLAIGCYEAPDYTATRFKCDSTHACPGNQSCVNGACTGGIGDAGVSSQIGVACGGTTCVAGHTCCLDFAFGPGCVVGGGAACDGIVVTCDGVEDCGGNACCESGIGFQISCSSSLLCTSPGVSQICRDATDCTDPTAKMCCYDVGLPGEPWGRCRPGCPI